MTLILGYFAFVLLSQYSLAATTWGATTVSATTTTITSTTLTATATDESVLLVEASGVAYLTNVIIVKTGDASDDTSPSSTNLNAAIGVADPGTVYLTDCTITTDGVGANPLKLYEDGSYAYVYNLEVTARGDYAHGVYAAGGYIYGENVTVTTYNTSGSAIATDSNAGTIYIKTATAYTYGAKSALVYSTGNITVEDLTGSTYEASGCVIDGSNSWTLVNPDISAAPTAYGVFETRGTGERLSSPATMTVNGGSVAETRGDAGVMFCSNIDCYYYLDNVSISTKSGILANSSAADWGISGSNEGGLYAYLAELDITGDVYVDDISTVAIYLYSTSWSGAINPEGTEGNATVYVNSDSTWTVTGTSYVTVISCDDSDCSNIYSDGFTVYYDSSDNSWLGGETISLSGGGELTPS
ncbi:hypothetical protein N7462_003791 [Penicillium macrosclerotiorum]|uniref:uncharacterized protein n=1 Tax=Penicillium macrosclerotiorum TaxID=303699 RepID=UPI0025479DED|nr:uncharacterized protein N7462_003791 [Penicillium macrosclerotiorum]KAJ5689399.1 hypothetical protein N7462_003791 [Penicillium macrosclerotiorum]